MSRLENLSQALRAALDTKIQSLESSLGEITVVVRGSDFAVVSLILRDNPELSFEQLTDLCGMDHSAWGDSQWDGPRFSVVVHLLSIKHNYRLRLRAFADDDDFPVLDTVTSVWPNSNWYEREAFDLFGIVFQGHSDLRRILTDYGFIGHPFRKDFPLSGNVEMRYDPEQKGVVYQPVTIEPREITPRIVREQNYGDSGVKG